MNEPPPRPSPSGIDQSAASTAAAPGRCPACLSHTIHQLFTITVEEAAQHFVLQEEFSERNSALAAHIRAIWRQDACAIAACRACGSGFAEPFVSGDVTFYNLAYPRAAYPKRRWEFRRTATSLRGRRPFNGLAVEIGSGAGFFLDLVCPEFFATTNVLALEYNKEALASLRAKGYRAEPLNICDASLDPYLGRANCIFMFQVLEHLSCLDTVFARLQQLAAPDGSLFIAVPNKERTDYQESSGCLIDMPPNHVGRWTLRAFEALGGRHGFAIAEHQTEPISLSEFVRHDLAYSYLRRAQRSGSLANRLRSMPYGRARRALELGYAAATVPLRAAAWVSAAPRLQSLGASLWVHMRKL
jgi:SAM-dependent methyltransferase